MRIAVVCESSSADKNADIVAALAGRGHEIVNVGMFKSTDRPALNYVHIGLITAMLINLERVEYVVGGCGTGQGYAIASMAYPNVVCGQITSSLDAWLFTQINGGNCMSLRLNQGYGWASDINLRFIFDQAFGTESGAGYPQHRREVQAEARVRLAQVSAVTHKEFSDIIRQMPDEVMDPVMQYPGVKELIDVDSIKDRALRDAFLGRCEG